MKIKMLRNVGSSLNCNLSEGESGEVDTSLAETLIKRGLAVPISDDAKPRSESIKAVEPLPTIKSVQATPFNASDKKTK